MDSTGLNWTQLDSTGVKWTQLEHIWGRNERSTCHALRAFDNDDPDDDRCFNYIDEVQYDMTWNDVIRYDTVWYDTRMMSKMMIMA